MEAGYEFTDEGLADDHALGQLTVRLPLRTNIEVRASLGSYTVQSAVGLSRHVINGPLALGLLEPLMKPTPVLRRYSVLPDC